MPPALSTTQWIAIAVVAATGLVLAIIFLRFGLKLLKGLLILALVAFAAALATFLILAYRKGVVRRGKTRGKK
jgi:hypothetical protein